ncbi:hypothetical protein PVK06_049234 [Gossypium arboreum]|uniref:Uncharacterized protein n=1 Tax=Gossypium arboreum TaxID=29729 RepID=A0ABR0MI23_GOSAR|nr:hypothetical protein PVK06_049234 [Gossypium arboreum]
MKTIPKISYQQDEQTKAVEKQGHVHQLKLSITTKKDPNLMKRGFLNQQNIKKKIRLIFTKFFNIYIYELMKWMSPYLECSSVACSISGISRQREEDKKERI